MRRYNTAAAAYRAHIPSCQSAHTFKRRLSRCPKSSEQKTSQRQQRPGTAQGRRPAAVRSCRHCMALLQGQQDRQTGLYRNCHDAVHASAGVTKGMIWLPHTDKAGLPAERRREVLNVFCIQADVLQYMRPPVGITE